MKRNIHPRTVRARAVNIFLSLACLGSVITCAAGTQIATQLPPTTPIAAVAGGDSYLPIVSPDGRYVLFASTANNLVTGSGGQELSSYVPVIENVFLRDRQAGTTVLVSINVAGTAGGNGNSWPCAISTNGQYALFQSDASDLIAGDTNRVRDVFLRDLVHATTTLVSVGTDGFPGNGASRDATMTPDGRFVAFVSGASNLVAGDTNRIPDIFVRDMQNGTTVLASPGATATPPFPMSPFTGTSSSEQPIISPDGRYVAFYSTATNLVSGNGYTNSGEVFVRDLLQGVTIWASSNAHQVVSSPASANYAMSSNGQYIAFEASGGKPPGVVFRYKLATGVTDTIYTNGAVAAVMDWDARNIDINGDGSIVVFTATNGPASPVSISVELWSALTTNVSLVSGGTVGAQADYPRLDQSGRYVAFFDNEASLTTNSDGQYHAYLSDTVAGTVQLVDVGTNGVTPFSFLMTPFHFTANGNLMAFECLDGTMSSDPNKLDIFARDLVANTTEVVSAPAATLPSSTAFGPSGFGSSSVSSNGQFVAFYSDGAGLGSNSSWSVRNVFVHDFVSGSNTLASVSADGLSSGNNQSFNAAISGDGRYVAFESYATNLVANDTNASEDVFVRDLQTGSTILVSTDASGAGEANGDSSAPQISANGRYVLFFSAASNIVSGAGKQFFWKDLQAGIVYATTATNAVMTPDGSNVLFATGSQLNLWQSQNQSVTAITALGSGSNIVDIAVSLDGTRGAFGTTNIIYIADLVQHTNTPLGSISKRTPWPRFQFSGNSQYLANLNRPVAQSNQVFVYNFQTGSNTPVSQSYLSGGANADCDSAAVSADGRYVAYRTSATNLVPGDTNAAPNIFIFDQLTGGTTLVSTSIFGNRPANSRSLRPVFSGDGRTLFFQSWSSDLAANDFNQASDVFALSLSTNGLNGASNGVPIAFSGIFLSPGSSQITSNQPPILTWPSSPGFGYQVQFKTNLTDPQWQNLNGFTVVGSQGQIVDPAPDPVQRFYRIISY